MCQRLLLTCMALVAGLGFIRPASAELIGYWSFDEGAGEIAKDGSGNGNDGTLENGTEWTAGKFGSAVLFDGTDDCVNLGNAGHLSVTDDFTFSMWVKISAYPTSWSNMLSKLVDDHHVEYNFRYKTATEGQFYYGTGSAAIVCMWNPTEDLPLNTWTHIAGVRKSGTHLKLYFNGVEKRSLNITAQAVSTNANVTIGRQSNNIFYFNGMIDEVGLFTEALEEAEIQAAMSGLGDKEFAAKPNPANGAVDVSPDVVLGWGAGEFAATHDVYFGTSAADVDDASRANPMGVLVSQGQTDTTYVPDGVLDFETTYYWRVDEVNAAPDNTIFKGETWSFTAEPLAYPITDVIASTNATPQAGAVIENTVNGSGLNADGQHSVESTDMFLGAPVAGPVTLEYEFDGIYKLHEMLVWNYNVQFELLLGFGIQNVTVEYSVDGDEWTILGDVDLAQGTAKNDYVANSAIDFAGAAARFVKLTVNSGFGMMAQYGLSEVRFMYIPATAREPQPADGAVDVSVDAMLAWRPGRDAVSHDVYLGTDAEALLPAETVETASYLPDALNFGTTYAWRIDENQEAESWEGPVWNFATEEYVLIEGFESYDDEDNRIYQTWIDGYGVDNNGSTVGYLESPFAEKTIVNSGGQSMPLAYANTGGVKVSEATRDLGALDMDTNGAEYLRLFVSGSAPVFFEAPDGAIVMNGIGNDIWNAADQCRYAYKQLTGDGSMVACVDALDGTPNSWAKGGIMIRQGTEAGAVNTFMAMTGGDGGGATFQQRPEADVATVSQHTLPGNPFAPPYWVRLDREGNAFSAYISPDGETWTQAAETVTVEMADPVLIGLALTSHNDAQATGAAFSNISFTGDVTGAWQIAEIGVAQPAEGNEPQPLYVTLEDNAGQTASVTHPNAAATVLSGWTEWLVPYSDLAGVNLNSIASLTVGVGHPNGGSFGTGLIFIDDISFGRPASTNGN